MSPKAALITSLPEHPGPAFGRVRLHSSDGSPEVTLSIQQHVALTALLPMNPALRSSNYTGSADDNLRLLAAEWLAQYWLHHPIPWARWPIVRDPLAERAEAESRSIKEILWSATVQAIFLVLSEHPPSGGLADYLGWLRAQVANKICDDLLGPGSRRPDSPIGDEDMLAEDPDIDADTSEEELARLIARVSSRASLSQRETEVLSLWSRGYSSAEISSKLGITATTVRVVRHHIRGKVKPG